VIITGAGRAFCAGTDISGGFDLPHGGNPETGDGVPPDIGGVTVLAGVHLSLGLDTLIPPSQSDVYTELLSLQRGDDVIFSGRFLVHSGSLVEMSYTGSGAISAPEFLFEFSELSRRPTPENSEN
jgi:hypothetical protein